MILYKFIIFVKGGHCDNAPQSLKKPSYATVADRLMKYEKGAMGNDTERRMAKYSDENNLEVRHPRCVGSITKNFVY